MSHYETDQIFQVAHQLMPMSNRVGPVVKFTSSALVTKTTIYYLSGATPQETKCVLTALTLCGKSTDTIISKWQSWVCTWSCVVFPELVPALKSNLSPSEYVLEAFTPEFVAECKAAVVAQGAETTARDMFVAFPPSLPKASAFPINADLAGVAALESLYQYYAMMVFILGKSLNPESMVSISSRRPEALMRKANSRRGEYILIGNGRIASENYGRVQGGWVRSTGPRKIIIAHLAALYAAPDKPETLDPIVVNMDMLRNAGQSYIFYIHELVVAHPWAIKEIHPLRAAWTHYMNIVNILTAQPPHLIPFYKMMMQDSNRDVRRKDIEPLIGVAIFYASQTRPNMHRYRIAVESTDVIAMFVAKAKEKGHAMKEVNNQATIETLAV